MRQTDDLVSGPLIGPLGEPYDSRHGIASVADDGLATLPTAGICAVPLGWSLMLLVEAIHGTYSRRIMRPLLNSACTSRCVETAEEIRLPEGQGPPNGRSVLHLFRW
jgi:hypothetical protein